MACIKVRWSYLNSHLQTKKKEKKNWLNSLRNIIVNCTHLFALNLFFGYIFKCFCWSWRICFRWQRTMSKCHPVVEINWVFMISAMLTSTHVWPALPWLFSLIGILIYAPNLTNYHLICVELRSQVLTISRRFHIQNHTRSECFWVWYVTHRRKVNYVSSSPIY